GRNGFVKGAAHPEALVTATGRCFVTPHRAARILGISATTLREWAEEGCPWLSGARLPRTPMRTPLGRVVGHYFLGDLLGLRARLRRLARVPELSGLTHLALARRQLGVADATLRQLLEAWRPGAVPLRLRSRLASPVLRQHKPLVLEG